MGNNLVIILGILLTTFIVYLVFTIIYTYRITKMNSEKLDKLLKLLQDEKS